MKYIFIINPVAGKQKQQKQLIAEIRRTLPAWQYELHFTTCPGDGQRLAALCVQRNHDIILFACGGDGTFFEVINGSAGQVPVGVFPCGSGNDFIKNILSEQILLDLSAQLHGAPVPLDLIRCNGNYVANVCNIGFDADIAYHMTRFKKLPLVSGKAAYLLSAVCCFFHSLGYPMTIQLDDEEPRTDIFLFALLANGQTYGGSFRGAPCASVTDGLLDVCLCKKVPRMTLLKFLRPFQKGTYLKNPSCQAFIHYQKCHKVHLSFPSPTITGYDGNITSTTTVEAEIVPAAIQLMVPQGARLL